MNTPRSRYSPVMPIALLQSLVEYQQHHMDENIVGDYFLVLAHDVLEHPHAYADIFEKRGQIPKNSFVILDNSVIELGKPLGVEFLLGAADIVKPDCIILPDVLGDMQQSVRMVRKSHNEISVGHGMDNIEMMAVLQGRNVAELTRCAAMYAELEHVTYFGAPRWVSNKIGTRKVFETVLGIHHQVQNPNVHMLGMSNNLSDDIACTRLPGVMGIDSANPCVMGQRGISLNKVGSYKHLPREEGTFDYWKETEVTQTTINNILTMRRLLDGRG